jgi:hypothetical protein
MHLVINRTPVIIRFLRVSELTLYDHVVHDFTSMYHLPHMLLEPGKSRVPDNSLKILEHIKCSVDILLVRLLP